MPVIRIQGTDWFTQKQKKGEKMLNFDFEKLKQNCLKAYYISNWDSHYMLQATHEGSNLPRFAKTLHEKTGTSIIDTVAYFSKNLNKEDLQNFDCENFIKKIKNEQTITCQADCQQNCRFKDFLEHPFSLGFKEVKPDIKEVYPTESFPEPLKSFIAQSAEAMAAPPQNIGTSLLAVSATLCSRFAEVQATPTWEISLLGYFLVVGDVSTKKSPSMKTVLSLIDSEYVLKDDRLITNDSTMEALAELLNKNKSILLHADESGTMETLGGYTKTKSASSSKLLSLYSGNPLVIDRKGEEPIVIKNPKLSILAGVQPNVLKSTASLMTTGMLQRFFISYAKRSKEYLGFSEKSVDLKVIEDMQNLVKDMYEYSSIDDDIEVLTLSKEALELFKDVQEDLYADMENTENPALQDYYGKYKEHILKIAGLFHLVRRFSGEIEGKEISAETFEMALKVSMYYFKVSSLIFNDMQEEKPIDTEEGYKELLKKSKDGKFTPTFLNKCGIGGCDARKPAYTEKFIDRLLEQNRCIEIEPFGRGRLFLLIKE